MQLKTLVIFAVIAIISVGFAFVLITKGYIRIGKPGSEEAVVTEEPVVVSPDQDLIDEMVQIEEELSEELGGKTKASDFIMIPLDPIIVNLKDSFGRRYLKTTVNLGIEEPEVIEGEAKKKEKKPVEGGVTESVGIQAVIESKLIEVRDILISILSSKTMEEVDGWANQDMIRSEIKDKLNEDLGLQKGIKRVFFTEFVIQ